MPPVARLRTRYRGPRHTATAIALLVVGMTMVALLLALKHSPQYDAEIRRTAYGVPHVRARNWGSLGYGYGYAYAQDNACLLAERVVTVRGERSRYFGPQGGNVASDIYHQAVLTDDGLERLVREQPRHVRALVRGFATGFSRALSAPEADAGTPCRDLDWLRPPAERDLFRHFWALTLMLGSEPYAGAIARATPPSQSALREDPFLGAPISETTRTPLPASNAYALGREVTSSGKGLLLANPHLAWSGVQRFYPVHLTIPGTLDVMGASLQGVPTVLIGFNQQLAWTATVSTAQRATLYELALVPGNPTAYRYDGKVRQLERREVRVTMLDPRTGNLISRQHEVYFSHFGPVLETRGLGWTPERAFAIRDANLENSRFLSQFIELGRSTSLDALASSLRTQQGVPWSNTLAVDAAGEALYADVGVVPHVDDELRTRCMTPLGRRLASRGVLVLDGSRSDCEWLEDDRARQPGIYPPEALPVTRRTDYLANSNDSPWLSNPAAPMTAYPRIVGDQQTPRTLRTRLALDQIRARLEGRDGLHGRRFDHENVTAILFRNRDLGAELLLDDLLTICTKHAKPATDTLCDALARWDRRNDLGSRGSHAFKEVMLALGPLEDYWRIPFDPSEPLHTPRDLAIERPRVRNSVIEALDTAAARLRHAGIDPAAPLGDVQFLQIAGLRIPIHGGSDKSGAFNVIEAALTPKGYTPIEWGSSFILVVGFDDDGPRAHMGLSYSLASDPASPYASSLAQRYATKQLLPLRFREAEIRADNALIWKSLRD